MKLNSKDYNELNDEVDERATEISILALEAVCKAIDENLDIVSLDIFANFNISLTAKKENYLKVLEYNIGKAVDAEAFELCAKVTEYIKLLKSNKDKADSN